MIGTDFNDGIKGVGPKTALKITKEADTLEDIQNALMSKYNTCIEGAEEVERIFLQPDIKKISGNEFHKLITDTALDKEGLVGFMCKEHGFSEERVEKMAELLSTAKKEKRQKDINSWL